MDVTKPDSSKQTAPVSPQRKQFAINRILIGFCFFFAAILLILVYGYNQQRAEANAERKRLQLLKATNEQRRKQVSELEVQQQRTSAVLTSIAEGKTKAVTEGDPRFEIGFGRIPLSIYLDVAAHNASDSEGAAVVRSLPVAKNEFSESIKANVRSLMPDLAHIRFANANPELAQSAGEIRRMQQAGQVKLREQSVTCLFLRQIGSGTALNVMLAGEQCRLNGALDLFDDTDISWSFYSRQMSADERKARRRYGEFSSRSWALGSLPHGKGFLIPLYLSSNYSSPKSERNHSSMQFVSGLMLIPERIKYENQRTRATVEIKLDEYLQQPVEIAGQFSSGGE